MEICVYEEMDFNVCDYYCGIQREDSQPVDLHHHLHQHRHPDKQSEQEEKKATHWWKLTNITFYIVNFLYVRLF